MIKRSLESLMAFHCAPALAGIKPASLFTWHHTADELKSGALDMIRSMLAVYDISLEVLCCCEHHVLILVYREDLMSKVFTSEAEDFMKEFGYPVGSGIRDKIAHLKSRLAMGREFPHEIGIFLGYPLVDVRGFIESSGAGFKAAGLWKVYGEEEETLALFDRYRRCTEFFCRKLESGCDIRQLLPRPRSYRFSGKSVAAMTGGQGHQVLQTCA